MPSTENHPQLRPEPGPATVRSRVRIPLSFPDGFRVETEVFTFHGLADGAEHIALAIGDPGAAEYPLVRLHSECLTGDVFGSDRCDCGPQLREAVERIAEAGGYLLYLRQEGRGIGLYNKLDAYALQDSGLDTYQANTALGLPEDGRDYTAAAQMLTTLGATTVGLLSNNPDRPTSCPRSASRSPTASPPACTSPRATSATCAPRWSTPATPSRSPAWSADSRASGCGQSPRPQATPSLFLSSFSLSLSAALARLWTLSSLKPWAFSQSQRSCVEVPTPGGKATGTHCPMTP